MLHVVSARKLSSEGKRQNGLFIKPEKKMASIAEPAALFSISGSEHLYFKLSRMVI